MYPSRRTLLTVSALTLGFAPVALADNNTAHVSQGSWSVLIGTTPGEDNSALIVQPGSGNQAGSAAQAVRQQGRSNALELLQQGDNNQLGLAGEGFVQRSQTAGGLSNSATIAQLTSENTIGSVIQSARGGLLLAPASGNVLTIRQAEGDGNRIGRVRQMRDIARSGNEATLTQTGVGNVIVEAAQWAGGLATDGRNRMRLTFTGDNNNTGPLSGYADLTGVQSGHFQQGAPLLLLNHSNQMAVDVLGNNNAVGALQLGVGNQIATPVPAGDGAGIRILGSDNIVGAAQLGTANVLDLDIIGNGNNTGITQNGADNSAGIALLGEENEVSLLQEGLFNQALFDVVGNGNEILVRQFGVGNRAEISQNGNNNQAGVTQIGAANTVTVSQ